jgi:hypothetical protein
VQFRLVAVLLILMVAFGFSVISLTAVIELLRMLTIAIWSPINVAMSVDEIEVIKLFCT